MDTGYGCSLSGLAGFTGAPPSGSYPSLMVPPSGEGREHRPPRRFGPGVSGFPVTGDRWPPGLPATNIGTLLHLKHMLIHNEDSKYFY